MTAQPIPTTVDDIIEVDEQTPSAPAAPAKTARNLFKAPTPKEAKPKTSTTTAKPEAGAEPNPMPHLPMLGISDETLMSKPKPSIGSAATGIAGFFIAGFTSVGFYKLMQLIGDKLGANSKWYYEPIADVVRIGLGEVAVSMHFAPRIWYNIEKAAKYPWGEDMAKNHAKTMFWGAFALTLIDTAVTSLKYAVYVMKAIQKQPVQTAPTTAEESVKTGIAGLHSLGTLIKNLQGTPATPARAEEPATPEVAEVGELGTGARQYEHELKIEEAKQRELTSLLEMRGLSGTPTGQSSGSLIR
jgi:hypothetical protein